MKHMTAISLRLKKCSHTVTLLLLMLFIVGLLFPALTGCGKQNTVGRGETEENVSTLQQGSEKNPVEENASPLQQGSVNGSTGEKVSSLQQGTGKDLCEEFFAYDEAQSVQFKVMAAVAGEEESYTYPWGEYDNLGDIQSGGNQSGEIQSGKYNPQT